MATITINNPLHITTPRVEGCWLQIDSTGLTLNMNFPGVTSEELRCFSQGVRQSSLYVSNTRPAIPFILLEFTTRGFGPVEGSCNARTQYPEFLDTFMASPSPARMTMYLTDMGQIKGIAPVHLTRDITDRFKQAITNQLGTPYTDQEFAMAKRSVQQRYSTKQLYAMGHPFGKNIPAQL